MSISVLKMMNRNSRNGRRNELWGGCDGVEVDMTNWLLLVGKGRVVLWIADEVNVRNIRTLCSFMEHEFVRCHVRTDLYCLMDR